MTSFSIGRLVDALEGRRSGPHSWMAKCVAHEDRTPSLSIGVGGDGKLLFKCHAGCAQDAVMDALRARGLWGSENTISSEPPSQLAPGNDDTERTNRARDLWHVAKPVAGTLAETYLRSRGITVPLPATLRFLPAAAHRPSLQTLPALVAAVSVWPSKSVSAIQRTYLKSDGGGKAHVTPAKMSLGPIRGGAVRLGKAAPRLAFCEGIEDGLSIMQLDPTLPVWVTLGAKNLSSVILPDVTTEVVIVADNDANGVGVREAEAAAGRFVAQGREVRIVRPPAAFKDFNDALKATVPQPRLLSDAERDDFEERAAIAEYDGGVPRSAAEQLAWESLAAIVSPGLRGAA